MSYCSSLSPIFVTTARVKMHIVGRNTDPEQASEDLSQMFLIDGPGVSITVDGVGELALLLSATPSIQQGDCFFFGLDDRGDKRQTR